MTPKPDYPAIRARHEAATEGKWFVNRFDDDAGWMWRPHDLYLLWHRNVPLH